MKRFVPLVSLLIVGCSTPKVDIAPRYGQLDVKGNFTAGVGTGSNTAEQMGFTKDDGYLGARGDFKWGMPHLIVSAQKTDHSGQGTLGNSITIDGTTIGAGTAVDTVFDMGVYNALLLFDLLPTETFELGVGFGVTALDIDSQFTSIGASIGANETVPFPVLALNGSIQLSRFEVAALLSGVDASYDDNKIKYLDLDLFGRVALIRPEKRGRVSLLLGYRHLDVDLEVQGDNDILFDMQFDGPYAGLEVSF